jgi:hypothetical protein
MQILHFELKLCRWQKTIQKVQVLGFIGINVVCISWNILYSGNNILVYVTFLTNQWES